MKRLLLPLILVILITAVVFVSCAKEDTTPTTEPETEASEEVSTTTTTTTAKKTFQTFKTQAADATTAFKGTPVIYPTTSTTKATTTTTTTKASTTTTTTTARPIAPVPTPSTEQAGDQPEYEKPDEILLPMDPLSNDGSVATEFGSLLIKALG